MKKLFCLAAVAAVLGFAIGVRAEGWLQLDVPVVTNLTVVTLDSVFTPPVVFDGFVLFPVDTVFTNDVGVNYSHGVGMSFTNFYSVSNTNTPVFVKDIGLVVGTGDVLSITNSNLRGKMVLNFRKE